MITSIMWIMSTGLIYSDPIATYIDHVGSDYQMREQTRQYPNISYFKGHWYFLYENGHAISICYQNNIASCNFEKK